MPSNMPRPRSEPRKVFKRVQSRPSRNNAFGPYQTLIEKFYIQDERPLRWIMEYMVEHHAVDWSVKQYKSQLKNWGFRHKLTQRDAAFILRLLNQAKSEGREEVVNFSGRPRRRDDILKYIQRNEKLVDEGHLLSCISDDEDTPDYIKLSAAQFESERPTPHQLPPTPPTASPSGSLRSQDAYRQISPMRVPILSPDPSPRSSGEWTYTSSNSAPLPGARYGDEAMPIYLGHMNVEMQSQLTASRSQPAMPNIIGPFWPNSTASVSSGWCEPWNNNDHTKQWSADFTHAALSVTPAIVEQLSDLGLDVYRFGDHTHSAQLNDGSYPAYFVECCLYWLICAGQDDIRFQSKAEYYLDSAMFSFLCMLTNVESPAEECLGALSILSVLFDCYGQWRRLSELLVRCDELTKKHFGWENPLTMAIEFKKNMLQGGADCPPHDIARLAYIATQMQIQFPESARPALTARYNLAWAMLENELKKEVATPEGLEAARLELVELTEQCGRHFGYDRIETIMSAATLARATFHCGDAEEAENIIVKSVLPRIRRNFVDSHPYVWEAKHRHAFFLFQLARKESGVKRSSHLQLGEQLLREVVRDRYRVLGDSNPKSENSFHLLRDILKLQGRRSEADSLSQWCERELSQYGVY